MSKFVIAHDMEADDGRRWLVFDTDKAEAAGESWAEANAHLEKLLTNGGNASNNRGLPVDNGDNPGFQVVPESSRGA